MWPLLVAVGVLSGCHGFVGVLSICIGVAGSIRAEVWMAHSVAPIWSGAFFIVTSIMGLISTMKRTPYLIMCFAAMALVSLVTSVVSIQLLRLGLVNHTSDGKTYQKDEIDILIVLALCTASMEILVCLVSAPISVMLAKKAKKESQKKSTGTFSVQIRGAKDIVVHTNGNAGKSYKPLQGAEPMQQR